jgi:hypothetical protein
VSSYASSIYSLIVIDCKCHEERQIVVSIVDRPFDGDAVVFRIKHWRAFEDASFQVIKSSPVEKVWALRDMILL